MTTGTPTTTSSSSTGTRTTHTLGRSGIHHNILGAYNFMIIDDIAGVRPRLDDVVELWPIDVGYDHFTVNNLSYHGSDLTVVWDKPGDGTRHYGEHAGGLLGVRRRPARVHRRRSRARDMERANGRRRRARRQRHGGSVRGGRGARQRHRRLASPATRALVDMFQKAGVDLSEQTAAAVNLAEGRPADGVVHDDAPALQATAPANAVDGATTSGLPVQSGSYVARNPIWGDARLAERRGLARGRPRLAEAAQRGEALLLLEQELRRRREHLPGAGLRMWCSTTTGRAGSTCRSRRGGPSSAAPNYNRVDFPPVTAQRVRVLAAADERVRDRRQRAPAVRHDPADRPRPAGDHGCAQPGAATGTTAGTAARSRSR